MSIFAIIGAVIKLFSTWFSGKMERDARRREQLKDVVKEMHEGIKNRDASAITSAFDKRRRVR